MIYGEKKTRKMGKFGRPTAKRNAEAIRKAKTFGNRATRRVSKQQTEELKADLVGWDEGDDQFDRKFQHHEKSFGHGHKVNAFLRWARKTTKDLPQEERLSHVLSLVPETDRDVMRRRLERYPEFQSVSYNEFFGKNAARSMYRDGREPNYPKIPPDAEVLTRLRDRVERGEHAAVNSIVKRWSMSVSFHEPLRLLSSLDDIEDFWSDVKEHVHDVGGYAFPLEYWRRLPNGKTANAFPYYHLLKFLGFSVPEHALKPYP